MVISSKSDILHTDKTSMQKEILLLSQNSFKKLFLLRASWFYPGRKRENAF